MKHRLTAWTLAHFAVDMSCFYILYRGMESLYKLNGDAFAGKVAVAFLVYDCIAFGLQMVLGHWADNHPKIEKSIGLIGLSFMLIPLGIIWISQSAIAFWIALVLCALMNAAFHVGGGMSVLKNSDGKIAPAGIFVSSGALGVIAGTLYGKSGQGPLLPSLVIIASTTLYLIAQKKASGIVPTECRKCIDITRAGVGVATLCLFVAIFIRSYAGILWPLGFEKVGLLVLVPSISSFLGKALGGVIADKTDVLGTAVISLALSVVLLLLGGGHWFIIGLSIMLFNMAMPLTLCGLASAMPDNQGFAFGLSTFALLLGYLAFVFFVPDYPTITVVILTFAAIILIALSIKRKTN